MIGKARLCTILAACLLAAAPAAAQVNAPNPFELPRSGRIEHPGRHRAWRQDRRGDRIERPGERMERQGRYLARRGERWERRGRWMRRHGHPVSGRAFSRQGTRWERRGDRFERRGARLEHRGGRLQYPTDAPRLRHRSGQERRDRWHDGSI